MPAHYSYSFLDINPLARGHALVIPKCPFTFFRFECHFDYHFIACLVVDHAEKLHELPDEYLADALPLAKKIAIAQGAENYNILQVGAHFPIAFIYPSTPRRRAYCFRSNDLRCFFLVIE